VHDQNHPDGHALLRGVRGVLDGYDERMAVGEVYLMDPNEVATYYGDGDELHLAFNFSFLRSGWAAESFRREVERFEAVVPEAGWPVVVLSNHDVKRHASRYDDPELGEERARLAAMMLLTLRGTPFLYYGEEIGMRNVAIPEARLQDPLARTLHPKLSRDGERTPMQWEPADGGGFSTAEPWLPLGDAGARSVDAQRDDPASLLCLYRRLIDLRRRTPALHSGSYRSLDAPDGVFAYERRAGSSRVRVALNFTADRCDVDLADAPVREVVSTRSAAPTLDPARLEASEGIVLVFE
jgi:glycosidase